jgi:16S rRNA processing protein RimM
MTPRDLILVGVIIGAHGIRGEVKLKSFTADPKAVATYGPLRSAKGETFEITRLKLQTEDFIAALKNVTDRNRAEELKGTELFITRAQLPKDELYLHDLIGAPIYNGDVVLGAIIGFENFGAGDLIDVKIEGRSDSVLIPYNKTFIVEASPRRVVVTLPDDYLDESEKPNL